MKNHEKKNPDRKITKGEIHQNQSSIKIRLNKYIASSGICSRREADTLIAEGKIAVNGDIVTELGSRVSNTDEVSYNGKKLSLGQHVYILLNKPKNCETTVSEPLTNLSVKDLIKHKGDEKFLPVGSLDKDTSGVLLLTNDNELTEKLTQPNYNKLTIYNIFLDKELSQQHFDEILKGFDLEDGFIKADTLSYVENSDKNQVGMEIRCGRNQIVRRIFTHLGYEVTKLDRVYFAGLTKKGLQRGHWRYLSEKEVSILKKGAYR